MTGDFLPLVDGFGAMAEHSPDAIARFDRQGQKTYANAAYRRAFDARYHRVVHALKQAMSVGAPCRRPLVELDAAGQQIFWDLQFIPEYQQGQVIAGWWLLGRHLSDAGEWGHGVAQLAQELAHQTRELQSLMEHSLDAMARFDPCARCMYANGAFLQQWNLRFADIQGQRPTDIWACDNAGHLEAAIRGVFQNGKVRDLEQVRTEASGLRQFLHWRLIPGHDVHDRVLSVLAIGRDITAQMESQRLLARAESLAHIGHWQWDFALQRSQVSDELCRLFGKPQGWQPTPEQALAESPIEDRDRIFKLFHQAYALRQPELAYTYRITNTQGETLHLHTQVQIDYGQAGPCRLRGTTRDISEIKRYETRLNEITQQDPLTGLPNRVCLNERVQIAIGQAAAAGHTGGLLLVNLDRFKEVNDMLGHGHGDHLLVQCGKRLQQLLRPYDTVARLGGDEFAVLMPQVRGASDLEHIAKKIDQVMAQPFYIGQHPLFVTCCIGIAKFPGPGMQAHDLLHQADVALTAAKARGRASHHVYSVELTEKARERAQWGNALRRAEPEGQLEVFYQPKVDLANGTWVGAEALLRWHHPQLGLVTPDRFIGLAEEHGLIVGIGTWVLTKACLAVQAWNADAPAPFKVAVNLSPLQFRQDDLSQTVRSVLLTTGCQPEWLELEITENLLLDASEGVRTTLCALREMGITVAIDDFGTGYSSLAYLKRFPIDVLKVDRTFVRDIGTEHSSTELAKAIVSMGASLDMELVAEGVETAAQAEFLYEQGCRLAQGYLYGRPMPKSEFETMWERTGGRRSIRAHGH